MEPHIACNTNSLTGALASASGPRQPNGVTETTTADDDAVLAATSSRVDPSHRSVMTTSAAAKSSLAELGSTDFFPAAR